MKKAATSEFVRNVLTLLTGTALGQVVALALSVVVTRIYDPEMFASLEHFAMFVGILGVIAGGKYEAAIMLPKLEEEARHLLYLTIRIGFFSSLLLTLLFTLSAEVIANLLGNPQLAPYLWLIGPTVFFFVVTTALGYWFSRQKNYRPASVGKILFSSISEPAKIGWGMMGVRPGGLLFGAAAGHLASAAFLWFRFKRQLSEGLSGITKEAWRKQAKVYSDYPKYSIVGSLLNRLAQWLHIALLGMLFGEAGLIAVGFLGLGRRLVMAPLTMLAGSFSQVFYQRITEIHEASELRRYYLRGLSRFLAFGVLMIVVVWLIPDGTMGWIFGAEWEGVMPYLRVLVFWFAANFAVTSIGFILHRIRKQRLMLQLDATHLIIVLIAVLGAWYIGTDVMGTLIAFVIGKVLYYIINVVATLRHLKVYLQENN